MMPTLEVAIVMRAGDGGFPMVLGSLADPGLVRYLLLLAIADADARARRCNYGNSLAAVGARKHAVVLRELLASIEADHSEPLM